MTGDPNERERRMEAFHRHLTADFVTSGIDLDRFGFYDQPAFLVRESIDPTYLERYAEWVATRSMSAAYAAHVRAVVPKLAELLAAALAADRVRGRCIATLGMVTRMLDMLGVWSFGVYGSTVLEISPLDLRIALQTVALKPGPDGILGHAWVCAPPFAVVDISLALQHWSNSAIENCIPPVVLVEFDTPTVWARVEDCLSREVRTLFADAEGWRDPRLHHRLDPRLAAFHRKFPAREVATGELRLRFVPVAIRQPGETLAEIKDATSVRSGLELWSEIVAPAFGLASA